MIKNIPADSSHRPNGPYASPYGLRALGQAADAITKFKTFTRPDRVLTTGLVAVQGAQANSRTPYGASEAVMLDGLLDGQREEAAAQGKVIFLVDSSSPCIRAACFQVHEGSAAAAFCGNATAAALAHYVDRFGPIPKPVQAVAEGATVTVESVVKRDGDFWSVEQTWHVAKDAVVEQSIVAGRPAARSEILNKYSVLLGPLGSEELAGLLGTMIDGPSAKLAVITPAALAPKVDFFNCNGRHGAAPQTGLATLALLRGRVDWLGAVLSDRQIITPGGIVTLPQIDQDTYGSRLRMPSVNVHFQAVHPMEELDVCTVQ